MLWRGKISGLGSENMNGRSANATRRSGEAPDEYRRLIESLTDYAIFSLSIDGRISSWNSGAMQAFGYDEKDVLGKPYSMLFTPEDIEAGRPQAELIESLERGKSSVDGWHVRKNGSRLWCNDTVQPLRDRDGVHTGFTKIVRDSTDRYLAIERLRQSEERLRLVVEGVTEYAILSIDPGGEIQSWNSGASSIFGYDESEVLGKHVSLIYTDEAIARGDAEAEMALATEEGHAPGESWHLRRNGDLFFAGGEMTILKADADGKARGFVKITHDITARNEADQTIKRQAFHDELTQLPNRAYFSDCLRRSIARVKRHPADRFAVIFLDLDRFKVINDSVGHVLADTLLVHVARALERSVRPTDVVARIGGDEFAILVSEIGEARDATRVAVRIHAALHRPFSITGMEVITTASMGIAIGTSSYDEPDQILRDADTAMYEAKARGRSRHVLFQPFMHGRAVGLLKLQMDLRRALDEGQFVVEYQPVVSLEECRVVGFEALVRWNHPDRGFLLPGEFIAEAENIGVIVAIDRWVLNEACRQLRQWQQQYDDPDLTVSVNVSSKQFAHENFLTAIREALELNSLAGRTLKLELTETVLMEQVETTAATVAQLGELGVELYIDDFGTGYSSLSYLTRFPLKILKVDRSFVSQSSSSARSAVIARTVVTLAHNLGIAALAEGIETEQQLRQLRELGCDFGQGFFFSKALPPASACELIGNVLPFSPARREEELAR